MDVISMLCTVVSTCVILRIHTVIIYSEHPQSPQYISVAVMHWTFRKGLKSYEICLNYG